MSKEKIVFVKENTIGSMLQDTFTFGTLVASFWFNYRFIDGNNTLDVLLFVCFFFFALGKAGNYRKLAELTNED